MQQHDSTATRGLEPTVRILKVESDGDYWKGIIKPKIRLKGHWLEQAGFKAGARVSVTCIAPGHLELRSAENLSSDAQMTTSEMNT